MSTVLTVSWLILVPLRGFVWNINSCPSKISKYCLTKKNIENIKQKFARKSFFCMFRFSLKTDSYRKSNRLAGKPEQHLLFSKQKSSLNVGGIFLRKYIFVFPGSSFFVCVQKLSQSDLKKAYKLLWFSFCRISPLERFC